MNLLKTLLFVGDPLLIAFMASVLIGVFMKKSPYVITVKYISTFTAFLLYFLLYAYGIFAFGGVWMYIIMFAPWAFLVVFIIVSLICAPKGTVKNAPDDDYGLTGFDTAFPNDIDKTRK